MTENVSPPGTGGFVLSLDLELMWGVRDHKTIEQYGNNILGVREAVPTLLKLFKERQIACTWATVGLLFAKDKADIKRHLPNITAQYVQSQLDPYQDLENIGEDEKSDPYHYGRSIIDQIMQVERQEMATHTFGHYYCLEEGASPESFDADVQSALTIMARDGVKPKSIVFPRNQYNEHYVRICAERDITVYRGTEQGWLYQSTAKGDQSQVRRGLRLADAYVNLSGANCRFARQGLGGHGVDIGSSRFLRPWSRMLVAAEPLRLYRIKSAMRQAARKGGIFHLWFHPHNFGMNLTQNMQALSAIIDEFGHLQEQFNWKSLTMEQAAQHFPSHP